MTLFKPRVGKVIFAQTTGGLSVIIPFPKDILVFKVVCRELWTRLCSLHLLNSLMALASKHMPYL